MKKNRIVTCLTAAVLVLALIGVTACSNGNSDDDEETPVTTTSSGSGSGSGSGSSGSGTSGGSSGSSTVVTIHGYMYMIFDGSGNGSWYVANDAGTGYDEMMSGMTYTIAGSTITFSAGGGDAATAVITSGTSFKISLSGGSVGSGSGTIASLNGKTYVVDDFTIDSSASMPDVLTFTEGTAPSAPSITY